ncbi:preprotein translocase subunit SecE [Candidatus Daviesbacteria bacterium]|nr:preprotein translocase subunit SecE [Candidatus Daviesbacteria bacterium]
MNKAIFFLKEVKEELEKVVWPTREQTIRYTILVIIVAVAVGLALGGLDYILTLVTNFLVQSYGQ